MLWCHSALSNMNLLDCYKQLGMRIFEVSTQNKNRINWSKLHERSLAPTQGTIITLSVSISQTIAQRRYSTNCEVVLY